MFFVVGLPMEPRYARTDTRKRAGYRVYFDLADDISVNHVIAPKQAKAALTLQRIFRFRWRITRFIHCTTLWL